MCHYQGPGKVKMWIAAVAGRENCSADAPKSE
jgi:hypothetical protein